MRRDERAMNFWRRRPWGTGRFGYVLMLFYAMYTCMVMFRIVAHLS